MKIGIISLGLIGGSVLKALSNKGHKLYAVTRNKKTLDDAKQYADFVSADLEILKDCEIVFVASPINKTIEMLEKLENIVDKNCIVLDCASVKEFVMKKRPYKFIGSHPMAGTEKNGFEASFRELFNKAVWVLTPFSDTQNEDIEKVKHIIEQTGARTIIANAKEHDRAVALISHFPLLVSQALFYSIKNNELAKKLASSGFRDMTRLSMSNTQMALDMMKFNSQNIDFAQTELFNSINYLKSTQNFELLTEIKTSRADMYSADGKNIYN